jgi:hypothetical protein
MSKLSQVEIEGRECITEKVQAKDEEVKPLQNFTVGLKFDGGKEPMDLIPTAPLLEIARVLDYGKQKYSAQNWRKGLAWSRVYAAAQRHLLKWNAGETTDPETGLNHLAHAAVNILFLLEYTNSRPEFDDRYKGDE